MNKVNLPQLRFPGFDGEWEKTLLKDVAEFRKGKGISKSDIVENGTLECIRYGELYTTYNEIIKNVVSKTNLPIDSLELSEYNDVIIPSSGETQLDIATASCILKSGIALGGDLNIIRSSINGIFLSFYLNNKKKSEIAKLAQGSSVVHLYNSQLKTLQLNVPSLPEQQKIASFLSAVDEKIQQLSRKKELVEQYKKGVMQQLFSGKLRFKPDQSEAEGDGHGKDFPDWEEKKLGELGAFKGGGTPATEISEYWNGDIPWISSSDLIENDISNINVTRFITEKAISESATKLIPPNSVLFISRVGVGKLAVSKRTMCTSQDFANFIPNEIDPIYLAYYFIENNNLLINYAQGTSIKGFTSGDLKSIKVNYPVLEEQQKIANFLSNIDVKIENTNQEINQMQDFKKGLLQQMFV